MIIFRYDKTFDGLLTSVFDAYSRHTFPEQLLSESETLPLFVNDLYHVITQREKSSRVFKGLQKKLSREAFHIIIYAWLSEIDKIDELIFKFILRIFDNEKSIETDLADRNILELKKIADKVNHEKHYLQQFTRFQKMQDNIYFAPVVPLYNALPLSLEYFKERFADQKWVIYDMKRKYGYFYDLKDISEIFIEDDKNFTDGKLNENLYDEKERLFQDLWKNYFKHITIKERINPKLHRQNLPRRFWKYLTEKQ